MGKQPQTGVWSPKTSEYRIRESHRAKYVSIRVSHWGEVEVVVPAGFDRKRLGPILTARQDWIQKTQARILRERQATPEALQTALDAATDSPLASPTGLVLPQQVHLRSIDETWQVSYQSSAVEQVSLTVASGHHLQLEGRIDQTHLCHSVLGRWVRDYARHHLSPWLTRISQETRLPFNRLAIRRQKTRWASCSNQSNINLNDKLLFIPAPLVRYVLIHELCHTIHLNHSKQFWALVEQKEPDYRTLDQDLRTAWRYVPRWMEL